ncbi:MAG: fibrobacter succinogenes major paralogous domain-containing protein [candidate division Zixibacteria bacterium]|nr:fibrobacter succinogenes major paralogous domain-containing protein [candidate division Zixibacteria bacterium]
MFKKSDVALLFALAAFILLLFVSCGDDDPVSPNDKVPILTTAAVSTITQTTAQCGGNIISDGGAAVTARGVCWSASPTPTIADSKTTDGVGAGGFTSSVAGLTASTPYYVRAYATNSVGTGYGNEVAFTTFALGTVIDIDGNGYQTVTIGTQVWLAENLKVTHYRNGEAIPNVTYDATWSGLTTGAYCEYNNDINNVATYGRLYNWYAVSDSRNIAPAGCHVPSDAEWQTLVDYLGGGAVAGGKMKETGTTHWSSPNIGATNESGFSGLPGGYRYNYGYYDAVGNVALYCSSTENNSSAWNRILSYSLAGVGRGSDNKRYGWSVRCVKD